jgi:hypothetical protein
MHLNSYLKSAINFHKTHSLSLKIATPKIVVNKKVLPPRKNARADRAIPHRMDA